MTPDRDEGNEHFLLLANGSAGGWCVDLDESVSGATLCLQLDGPQVYLALVVTDLGVIPRARDYLRSGSGGTPQRGFPLGRFGTADVCLHQDDEDPGRCFLIVGPETHSALRVTLYAQDIDDLATALEQVADDLPPEVRGE